MRDVFLDTILPGDAALGLPPGSTMDMAGYAARHGTGSRMAELLDLLGRTSREEFGAPFETLDADRRLACVERAKRKSSRLATTVIVDCLKAYYTDAKILEKLSAGSVPPFPTGNVLEDDDWTLLEPVYERGPIYRPVSS